MVENNKGHNGSEVISSDSLTTDAKVVDCHDLDTKGILNIYFSNNPHNSGLLAWTASNQLMEAGG